VKDVLVSLNHRTQGTQIEIEIMKPLVDTMWQGLEAKITEVTDDFLEGLKTARIKFKTQLEQVEFWAKRWSCHRTGTGAGMVQTPKFSRSTSWAVFPQQFETIV
jgi:hypothetical protein